MRYRELSEAQFRRPVIMYHGTSMSFLRSILKQGVVPDPRSKVWDKDDAASTIQLDRSSLAGSYWTSNLLTATSAAFNAAKKFDGYPVKSELIVIAQIAEQSAYADEDSLNIQRVFGETMHAFGLVSDAYRNAFYTFWQRGDPRNEAAREKMIRVFTEALQRVGGAGPHQPVDHALAQAALEAFLLRQLAHTRPSSWGSGPLDDISPENRPAVPSVAEAEANLKRVQDRLTRRFRASTLKADQFNHTLRLVRPVGFRGANKIVGIVEIVTDRTADRPPDKLWYGTIPADYLAQYRSRKGRYPGAVDGRTGRQAVAPDPIDAEDERRRLALKAAVGGAS